ncbi:MAG: hypothetical protein KA712_25315 [Myxococcales bacterium]|nr:hypothetical protein [Myxococcales bacterium]
MAIIKLEKLQCVKTEDRRRDQTYIEVKNHGQVTRVFGPRAMQAGDEVLLEGLSYEMNDLVLYVWDEDHGQGALYNPDDRLGFHRPSLEPGTRIADFTEDGAEYHLTYTVS